MILWLSALCGFLLLVLVGALYVGARARAGPLRKSRRIDYLCINSKAATEAGIWDPKSPPVVNVSPNMHHLLAPTCTVLHRPAGGVPA